MMMRVMMATTVMQRKEKKTMAMLMMVVMATMVMQRKGEQRMVMHGRGSGSPVFSA